MKHSFAVIIWLVGLFLLSQFVGLFVLREYVDYPKTVQTGELSWKALPSIAGVSIERPQINASISFVWIFAAVIVGTLLFLLLMSFRSFLLWKLWYLLAVTTTLAIAFGAFLPPTAASAIAIIFALLKVFKPNLFIHNATELFIYPGLAAIFVPIINLFAMFVILLLISAYDAYAVWKSRHMIRMAKWQAKAGIFAGLLIPHSLPKPAPKGLRFRKVRIKAAILGGGDIGFPLLFAGVAMKSLGFLPTLVIPIFVAASLLLLLIFGKKETFYPAMPFLSIGCVVGYLVALLFSTLL
ncbi:MAG: presenilin family intramembrane aspartyl protease [Candidatus Woesearchaeota archaeon]